MRVTFGILALMLLGCSQKELQRTMDTVNDALSENGSSLTTSEVTSGLKEALVRGTGEAVDISGVANGFFKNPKLFIPFPPEAEKVKQAAINLGLQSQVSKFEETLNRAAEQAVTAAKPIFVNAITSMTVEDAFGLLKGGDNAATNYLRRKTGEDLFKRFEPQVQKAVDNVELTKYYSPLASAYNTSTQFTGGEAINTDLTSYVTNRAIDGLFVLIAEEEKDIRQNPGARVTELLKKVFGSSEAK